MSEAVASATDVNIVVRPKSVPPHITDKAFHLKLDTARFREAEFVINAHLSSQEEVDRHRGDSPTGGAGVLSTGFRSSAAGDMPHDRGHAGDILGHGHRHEGSGGEERPHDAASAILVLAIQSCAARHTNEHVNMWTNPADIANHPNDLNIFGVSTSTNASEMTRSNRRRRPSWIPSPPPERSPAALPGCQARRNLQCSLMTPSGEPWRACGSYCGT